MKNTLPEKDKKEFGELYRHWVVKYICAPDAFDMDLRHSIVQDELLEWLSLKRKEWVEEAIKEERKRIEKLTDDFVPCDNKKHTIALLKLLNSLHSTP